MNLFSTLDMQEEFDTYDPNAHWFLRLQFLKKRSKIIEIVSAKDVIFALAQSGLCAAFSRSKNLLLSWHLVSEKSVFALFGAYFLRIFVVHSYEQTHMFLEHKSG